MITYTVVPKPARTHLATLTSGAKYLDPGCFGVSLDDNVRGHFPDGTAVTDIDWANFISAHSPTQTEAEEQAAKISAQAQALVDFNGEFPVISRAELETRIDAITDLASAKVFLKKLSLAVLWLLRQSGK